METELLKPNRSVDERRLKHLLAELKNDAREGRLDGAYHRRLMESLAAAERRFESERAEVVRQGRVRLGRRLLGFFGGAALCVGAGFLLYDYYDFFKPALDALQRLGDWLMTLPPQARALGLLLASGAALGAYDSRREGLQPRERSGADLAFALLLAADCFTIPDWLFGGSFTTPEHLLAGSLLCLWGLRTNMRTVLYGGLFLLCGWLGGGTAYGMGCYFVWMSEPVKFFPFAGLALALAWWLETQRKEYAAQPFEVVGLTTLFMALLILSIWGTHESGVVVVSPVVYVLELTVAACAATAVGVKFGRRRYYGFGLTFLSIDLYTRFYEVFSGWLPRPVFWLAFGGLSLWGARKLTALLRRQAPSTPGYIPGDTSGGARTNLI